MTTAADKYVPPSDKCRLVAITQDYENYAWGEDGELGVGDKAYWKAKGGSDWCIKELTVQEAADLGTTGMAALVEAARPDFEVDGEAMRSHLVDWELLPPGEMTETERQYLEYEGAIIGGSPCSVDWWKWAKSRSAA